MKRIFSHPLSALVIGLALRLFFVFRVPSSAGDTALYESLASNWLKFRIYGMPVNGVLTPLDIRMPGYPAYLALIQAITRRSAADSRLWVMLGQVLLDLVACLLIAGIAARCSGRGEGSSGVFMAALWLAALCPFTANYTAVPLTETFAVLTTALGAADAGTAVRVVADACAGVDDDTHAATLRILQLQSPLIEVVTLAGALSAAAAATPPSAPPAP